MLEVILPQVPVTTTAYVPVSVIEGLEIVNVDEVAPEILVPPLLHWYVKVPVPVAATVKLVLVPAQIFAPNGWVLIVVVAFTVATTAVLDAVVQPLDVAST